MASLDGRTLFVDPENPENDLKIISIDPELGRWGGVGLGATLGQTSCIRELHETCVFRTFIRNLHTCDAI